MFPLGPKRGFIQQMTTLPFKLFTTRRPYVRSITAPIHNIRCLKYITKVLNLGLTIDYNDEIHFRLTCYRNLQRQNPILKSQWISPTTFDFHLLHLLSARYMHQQTHIYCQWSTFNYGTLIKPTSSVVTVLWSSVISRDWLMTSQWNLCPVSPHGM